MSGSTPRFFCDVHVPLVAVRQLRKKGVDIVHSGDVGLSDAPDHVLLLYAVEQERVMVSCDEDFPDLHNQWQQDQREHTGIVFFRMPDQCKSIGTIVRELAFLHQAADYPNDLYNQLWRA